MRSDSKRRSGIGKIVTPLLMMSEICRPSRTREPASGCWLITTPLGYWSLACVAMTTQRSRKRPHSAFASTCVCPVNAGVNTDAALGAKNSLIERPNHTVTPTANASASASIQSRSSSGAKRRRARTGAASAPSSCIRRAPRAALRRSRRCCTRAARPRALRARRGTSALSPRRRRPGATSASASIASCAERTCRPCASSASFTAISDCISVTTSAACPELVEAPKRTSITPSTSAFSVSSSSESLPGSTSTMPRDANIQPTLPVSPSVPSLRLNRKRISDAVRLRLSVAASTITAMPAGP